MTEQENAYIAEAEALMKSAIWSIQETGSAAMIFVVLTESGQREVYLVDSYTPNNVDAKTAVDAKMRERISRGDVDAVFFTSDTFYAQFDANDPTAAARFGLMRAMRLNVEQAAASGLCEKGEALLVTCESRDGFRYKMMQEYRRDTANDKNILIGERRQEEGRGVGTFTNWFAPAEGARVKV